MFEMIGFYVALGIILLITVLFFVLLYYKCRLIRNNPYGNWNAYGNVVRMPQGTQVVLAPPVASPLLCSSEYLGHTPYPMNNMTSAPYPQVMPTYPPPPNIAAGSESKNADKNLPSYDDACEYERQPALNPNFKQNMP